MCQVLGEMREKGVPQAEDIRELMRRHPALRVAFVDKDVSVGFAHG
jgi:hypothetical protein